MSSISSLPNELAPPEPPAPPSPPSLHWALLLLIDIATLGIFGLIWCFVQARFAGKVNGSKATLWYWLSILLAIPPAAMSVVYRSASVDKSVGMVYALLYIASQLSFQVGNFSIKNALERCYEFTEESGRRLGGIKTILFSQIYLQYHMGRIAKLRKV